MSCDYGVWHSETSLTKEEAAQIYLALCEQWPFLEGENAAIRDFYDELTRRWPEIDTVPEEKLGDHDYCPWSCEICHSGMAVVTACNLALVAFVPWSNHSYPGALLLPIALPDFLFVYGVFRLAEKRLA